MKIFFLVAIGGGLVVALYAASRKLPAAAAPASSAPDDRFGRMDDRLGGSQGIAVGEPHPQQPTKSIFASGSCDCSSFWAGGVESCSCSGGSK